MKKYNQITILVIVTVVVGTLYYIKDKENSAGKSIINKATLKPDQKGGHIMVTPQEIKYGPGPDALPPGVKIAVIEGDMTKAGPFIARLQMPANYKIGPHTHPAIEHVTVLEGELNFGVGEKYDKQAAKKLPVGSISVMPIGHIHYAFTKDKPATVQLHGIGPWGITYVNPNDDPRNKAMK